MYSIEEIISDLKAENVVIMPTETVYGMAANACSNSAVSNIYKIKKRPSNNPLIVHGATKEILQNYVKWNKFAQLLANKFWPGPLTMVLPIKTPTKISHLVSAGNNSLAVRIPAHKIALKILKDFEGVLAAPSANPSQYISPTSIEHVKKCLKIMNAQHIKYIDGGYCTEGLESTIIDLRKENSFSILRHGTISKEEINKCIINNILEHSNHDKLLAPGMMSKHYCPRYKLNLNDNNPFKNQPVIAFGNFLKGPLVINLSEKGDLIEAAHNLFASLYEMENLLLKHSKNLSEITVSVMPIPNKGIGIAINDRLNRAAHL